MQAPYKGLILASLTAACLGFVAVACAEDDAAKKQEVAAIRAAATEYIRALRRGDIDAIRKMWTPGGVYMDASGRTYKIQEMLSRRDLEMPGGKEESSSSMAESTLRFVSPDVAVEDGTCSGGMTEDGRTATGRFTAIWVKRNTHWQIDSLREAIVASPRAKDRLAALEWLLGEWVGAADSGAILVSSHWSDDGHFIIREFAELTGGPEAICSTQRIGWDTAAGKIKCWTFDSQGGIAEGYWRLDGKQWIVEMNDVTPDGKASTTTATYLPREDGRFIWETASTVVAGQKVPPRRVEFKRAANK